MFDYIVVGAGTAGCTLAARLSEDPSLNVLLIEAGPPDRLREIRIPAAFPHLFRSPLDWAYVTEPQEQLGLRQIYWPRGKVMGGSGSMNAMIHLPGCKADFEAWKDLGNEGWGFADVAPLFAALPVPAAPGVSPHPLSEVFLQSCQAAGVVGALLPVAVKNGRRWSAADAFLRPALRRGNLTVWTRIQATRVVVEQGRATGVEYMQDGETHIVSADSEIVLAAGAIGSPQLLLLSGIGPVAQLESLGIPVSAELEGVGEDLRDHPAVMLTYRSTPPPSTAAVTTALNDLKYRARKTGPLTSTIVEAGAFSGDCLVAFAPIGPSEQGFSLIAGYLTPKSRGRLQLASRDPLTPPRIDPAYLSHPDDWRGLTSGFELAKKIAESEAFQPYRGEPLPGGLEHPECYIRSNADSLFHPVGGCCMGKVVNARLQVNGVKNLRVADASIMPTMPRTYPNATVMVIAEKAASFLR